MIRETRETRVEVLWNHRGGPLGAQAALKWPRASAFWTTCSGSGPFTAALI